jgi:hypothetical protein
MKNSEDQQRWHYGDRALKICGQGFNVDNHGTGVDRPGDVATGKREQ